jgi:hypothetical protein
MSEISKVGRGHRKVHWVNNLEFGSVYFCSFRLCKLGFCLVLKLGLSNWFW